MVIMRIEYCGVKVAAGDGDGLVDAMFEGAV